MDSLQRCKMVFFAKQLSAVCLLKPTPHHPLTASAYHDLDSSDFQAALG